MKARSRAKSNLAVGVVRGQNMKGNPEVVPWGLMEPCRWVRALTWRD